MKLFATLIVALLGSASASLPPAWELVDDAAGIRVFRKEIPDSNVIAFRGEAVIEASLPRVAAVLMDTTRLREWAPQMAEAKNLRQVGPFERIQYVHTSSGFFLVKDRDFVVHAKAELNKRKREMQFVLRSTIDDTGPETDLVRGQLKGTYTLTALDAPGRTKLAVEIWADPAGSLPKWIVNLYQRNWPKKAIQGIREQSRKKDVFEDAAVLSFFADRVTGEVAAEGVNYRTTAKATGTSSLTQVTQELSDAAGKLIAKDELSLSDGRLLALQRTYLEAKGGGRVELQNGKLQFNWKGPRPCEANQEVGEAGVLVPQMIPSFLRLRWPEVLSGNDVTAKLALVDRCRVAEVRFRRTEGAADGQVQVEMVASAERDAAELHTTQFTLERGSALLRETRGPSLPMALERLAGDGTMKAPAVVHYEYRSRL